MGRQSRRVEMHSVFGPLEPRGTVTFSFDGEPIVARSGDVIAAALLAEGRRTLGATYRNKRPRGVYCAIGHCFECQVTVDGVTGVRACLTPVKAGMRVLSGKPGRETEGER